MHSISTGWALALVTIATPAAAQQPAEAPRPSGDPAFIAPNARLEKAPERDPLTPRPTLRRCAGWAESCRSVGELCFA